MKDDNGVKLSKYIIHTYEMVRYIEIEHTHIRRRGITFSIGV